MTNRAYQPCEIETIVRLYPDVKAIRLELPDRTISSIKAKAGSLNLRAKKWEDWALWELKEVSKLHPDIDAIQRALPHRTRDAIKNRVRVMGIGRHRCIWSPERKSLLKKMAGKISDQQLAEVFGTTPKAIGAQRSKLGVAGKRVVASEVSRTAIVQDIRDEAARRGVSLYQITKALNCYKLMPSLTDSKVPWMSVVRVVAAFGGELYVDWED